MDRKIAIILKQKIMELAGEVKLLHKEIEELKKEAGKTTENQKTSQSLMGWTLQLKRGFWYAVKRINRKMQWLYIGKERELAEEKIRTWVKEHSKADNQVSEQAVSANPQTAYERFVSKVREVSKKLMSQERESSARLWEIRLAMPKYSKKQFDKYIQQMATDGLIYCNPNSDLASLSERQKEGSIMDDKKGLLFYLVWR